MSTKPPEDIYELNRQLVEQECKHQNVTSDPSVDDADWMKLVYVDDRQKLLYCLVSKVVCTLTFNITIITHYMDWLKSMVVLGDVGPEEHQYLYPSVVVKRN